MNLEKKKFLLVNHNTRINTEDTERETRLRGTFQKRTTSFCASRSRRPFLRSIATASERENSHSIHTHIGRLDHNPKLYMSLPFSLCFVLEKQREREKNDDLNARKARTLIALGCTLRVREKQSSTYVAELSWPHPFFFLIA